MQIDYLRNEDGTPYANYKRDVLAGSITLRRTSVGTSDQQGLWLDNELIIETLHIDVVELQRRMPEVVRRLRGMMTEVGAGA